MLSPFAFLAPFFPLLFAGYPLAFLPPLSHFISVALVFLWPAEAFPLTPETMLSSRASPRYFLPKDLRAFCFSFEGLPESLLLRRPLFLFSPRAVNTELGLFFPFSFPLAFARYLFCFFDPSSHSMLITNPSFSCEKRSPFPLCSQPLLLLLRRGFFFHSGEVPLLFFS